MNFPRRKHPRAPKQFERTIDANQIVGVNFRLARELRDMTQEEVGRQLARFNGGQVLPKASISAIERGIDRDRRRVFNAQELVAYSLLFDVPIWWFFLPIEGGSGFELEGTGLSSDQILAILVGTTDQLDVAVQALRASRRWRVNTFDSDVAADVLDLPSWKHFERAREILLAEHMEAKATGLAAILGKLRTALDEVDSLIDKTPGKKTLEHLAFLEYFPEKVYRKASEAIVGETALRLAGDEFPRLHSLMLRQDVPFEEWVDLSDDAVAKGLKAAFGAMERQLVVRSPAPSED